MNRLDSPTSELTGIHPSLRRIETRQKATAIAAWIAAIAAYSSD